MGVGLQRKGKVSVLDDGMNSRGFPLNQITQGEKMEEGKREGREVIKPVLDVLSLKGLWDIMVVKPVNGYVSS